MAERAVVTQNVLDFTVEIRVAGEVRGAGVVVSPAGHVLTCDHVVASVSDVEVTLPDGVARGATRKAQVVERDSAADLTVMQIVGGIEIPDRAIATLGTADSSMMHRFVAFGFPALGDVGGAWAYGYILGPVPGPSAPRFPPLQLDSAQIAGGMSGSAVLDLQRNLVVALVSDTWVPDATGKHRDTAWATDVANVAGLRTAIALRQGALPMAPVASHPPPSVGVRAVPGADLRMAPPPLRLLRGREALLQQLTDGDEEGSVGIASLVGFAGQGKSALARAWVDGVVERRGPRCGVLWWSFDDHPDVEEFFVKAFQHFADAARGELATLAAHLDRGTLLAQLVAAGPHLVVLDGVEAALTMRSGGGRLPNALRAFVRTVAAHDGPTRCLATSRFPVLDLVDLGTHACHPIGPLTPKQARNVLRDRGVRGNADALDRICDQVDRHALALVLVGSLIAERHGGDPDAFTSLRELTGLDHILDQYQAVLSPAQRCVLQVLSVQRVPLARRVLDRIARGSGGGELLAPLTSLSPTAYDGVVDGLVALGLVLEDIHAGTLSCHAVVKSRFAATLEAEPAAQRRAFHQAIAVGMGWNLKGRTYGVLGAAAALGIGMVATGRFNLAPISAVVNAASSDDLVREAFYFYRRSRAA